MVHKRFVYRQVTGFKKQALMFVLCVALSMVILVALNGFSDSVDRQLQADARKLHGGDIIVKSRAPFSSALSAAVEDARRKGAVQRVRTHEFYSMARGVHRDAAVLVDLKVVDAGYPLYGSVELRSGRPFGEVLTPGSLVVEPVLLNRLDLGVGDSVRIGGAVLTIRDVLESEPDRPVNVFSFGPRVFVNTADLAALDLLGKGSRVRYGVLLKVADEKTLPELVAGLKTAALDNTERVDTFRTARSRLKRFLDNFFFFLNLVGTFTLVLSGIGIYSSLSAFLREQEKTIAVLKTLGATSRFVLTQVLSAVFCMGLVGTLCGIGAGVLLQWRLPALFSGLLPTSLTLTISWGAVFQGLAMGLVVVALFGFLPVYRLKNIKPAAIFRKEVIRFRKSALTFAVVLAILIFFALLILDKMADVRTGGYFILGIAGLLGLSWLIISPILWALKRVTVKPLVLRQALKGLFRPGNATRAILVTMTASLAFVFSIYLVERNLNDAFVASYPPGAPNLFFLDIQPDQQQPFSRTLGVEAAYYPVVRARLLSINGRPVDPKAERERRGDNLGRTFNLTYRHHLLDDERLIAGSRLFPDDVDGIPVSVLDTVAKIPDPAMAVGDRITFRIQGIPLTATVTSIRSRVKESLSPFFYFLFPEAVLRDAPHTIFAAARLSADRIPEVQNRMVAAFPNVTVMDVTVSLATISGVVKKLTRIVRFFTLFSIIAGLLLIVSSVFATRLARAQEAVYYKILGAKGRFVLQVFTLENLALGLISGALAVLFSQTATWAVCVFFLDISYRVYPGAGVLLVAFAGVITSAAGLLPSLSMIRQKPMGFLKAQADE